MNANVIWVRKVSIGWSHGLSEGTVPPFTAVQVMVDNARVT
jgi:hypothetical protein